MYLPKEVRDGCIIVKIPFYNFDARQAPHVRQAFLQLKDEHPKVVMDLQDVKFLDSTGLGVILTLLREYKENDCELRLCNALDPVKEAFRVAQLESLFPLYDSADSAAESEWKV